MYTFQRPPVIKSSLGSTPWATISSVKPWIEYVVVSDSSATYSEGDTLALTGTLPHQLSQIANTPIWIHRLGDFITLPDSNLELAYYITAGDGGALVDEGTVTMSSAGGSISGEGIHRVEIIVPSGVQLPTSSGRVKSYPIKFIPVTINGDIKIIDNATLSVIRVSTATPILTNEPMINSGGIYTYNWEFVYTDPEDIYTFTIKAHLDASGTNFKTYHRLVETFKKTEYNPFRVKSGVIS